MILNIWEEYSSFFIIVLGILLLLNLVYLIFFRSGRTKKSTDHQEEKLLDDVENQDTKIEDDDEKSTLLVDQIEAEEDDFVLGLNSNILESIKTNDDDETEAIKEAYVVDDETSEAHANKSSEENSPFNHDHDANNKSSFFHQNEDEDEFDDDDDDLSSEEIERIINEHELLKGVEIKPENEYDVLLTIVKPKTEEVSTAGKFHVLPRKEDKMWYVKQEGKDETTRDFYTQNEAIAYATIQALHLNTTIVVHDEDGKIIKYDF